MMIDRRTLVLGSAALGALSACMPASPGAVTIIASGTAGMNTGPDGTDRPLTLQVVQLRGSGAFGTANFFTLQNPAGLGADFIRADAITLVPGGAPVTKTIGLDPAVAVLGVSAGFLQPAGKIFRVESSVSPTAKIGFNISVGPGGITMIPA